MSHKLTLNGQFLVLISASLYGLNPLFAQLLFAQGLGAEIVSLYRFILPALFFIFFLHTPRINWSEAGYSLLLGIGSGIAIFGYFHALETIPATTAILIYYSYPVFSVLIGWLLFNRIPSQNALISAALITIAASLTIQPEVLPDDALLPILGCLLAPLAVAIQVQYLSNPKQHLPTTNRMAWITIGHILVLLPIVISAAPVQLLPISCPGYLAVLGIALLSAAIPQALFMLGAPRSCADKNALAGSLELVMALLTGAILLDQPLNRLELTAMLLILLALLIKQVKHVPKTITQ